ncbi:MAG: FUSC family protein [Verrucomicrobia bacterium]|nr:FUSC family protein [Verrucomicrobiota bacterium]
MTTRAETVPVSTRSRWPLQGAFADLRVRYGIKLGLAGVLTLYVTQVLRLEHPSWAVLTVLVMMSAHYVGSIALKAILRVVGTICGALLGIWLVGDYTSTPVIFLTVVFFVIAFSSYMFGQFPASQVPYAYFLVGLTMLSVATYGVDAPDQVWQTGLNRTLEILVGCMCSLVVTTVLWPRYAREEFLETGWAALKTASQLVSIDTEAYLHGTEAPVEQIRQAFGRQLSVLSNLLQAGSRESTVFSARLSNYNAFVVSLTDLFHSALDLGRWRQEELPIFGQVQNELELLAAGISEEFDILVRPQHRGEKLPSSRLNEAFASFESKVTEIRDRGVFHTMPLETEIAFLGHFAALRSIRDDLNELRAATEGLPRLRQELPKAKPQWDFLPTIDWFWVKAGVKGGLASVIALLLLKWINPPGPPSIPLAAWTFSILGRPFLRAGGTGDLRAFQNTFRAALCLAVCTVLLLLTTPFLADYLVMNLTLFLILFVFGFLTARISGINFWMQLAFLSISSFVGLNPQAPVPSQTIIDTFLGLITGMVIATVIGRLIWPVLPQRVLRDDLLAIVARLKALLSGDPYQERIRTQLAILPAEALQASGQIRFAGCSQQERDRLALLVRALQGLVVETTELVSRRQILPEITEAILRPQFERLEIEFKQVLDAFAECFRRGDCRRELPSVQGALAEMNQAVERIRQSRILSGQKLEAPVRVLELVNRYHATAEALEQCGRLIRTLEIQRYWGDYAL